MLFKNIIITKSTEHLKYITMNGIAETAIPAGLASGLEVPS